jgi:diacylglycerol kinase (ATP)
MAVRLGFLVNPTAGKGRGATIGAAALGLLRAGGSDILDLSAPSAEEAAARAREALRGGSIDALVVAGGDGMTHLGVNLCAGTSVPLGIVAAGTGNDIARELGLPVRDAAAAVEGILAGRTRTVDAARVDLADGTHLWFAGVLAGGFDAVVNERANRWRYPRGAMRYHLAVLRELPRFGAIPYRLVLDGRVEETDAMLVAVGNGPAYGGGMLVTPDASMDDGLLDVLVLHRLPRIEFVRVFPSVRSGRHVEHPAVEVRRARTVHLDAPDIVAYADGERLGPLPLTIEAVPGALTVLG